MLDFIHFLVKLLEFISSKKESYIFSYIPEYYIETLVEGFHVLRRSDSPIVMTEG